MSRPRLRSQFVLPLLAALFFALLTYVTLPAFAPQAPAGAQAGAPAALEQARYERAQYNYDWAQRLAKIGLWLSVMFLAVRLGSAFAFAFLYRLRRGQQAPRLIRDIFSLLAYVVITAFILKYFFPDLSLGALLSGSALVGVILGLALQDTLGNLFAGLSLHADRPFDVGDVITVGGHTGVVESVTWRAAKLRTFQNHVVLVSNTQIAKEAIEVCPRDNANARLVYFNALYTDSPAKVIHVVREAIREAENVSREITPVVRVRDLGAYGVDYEAKYWLVDYAKYNDTDALVRQLIWYAYRRNNLSFAYPTQTLYLHRPPPAGRPPADTDRLVERLSAVDIFAPLSPEELSRLARAAQTHVYAPGESIIRAGEPGDSMFVVHDGRVAVQISDNGRPRTVATLDEGDFFGEMALLTGEPRSAHVVATEETEVLEIGHQAMRQLFDTNPDLVEALSHTVAERRAGLTASREVEADTETSDGLLSSIKRFFGLA